MANKTTIKESYISYSVDCMNDTELEITDIFVIKEDRGQGKGRELVESAIEYARENGYLTVGLYAEPQTDDGLDGDALIEFYRSCGFESDADSNELMTYTI